jgi:hypothetical protein
MKNGFFGGPDLFSKMHPTAGRFFSQWAIMSSCHKKCTHETDRGFFLGYRMNHPGSFVRHGQPEMVRRGLLNCEVLQEPH